MPKSTSKNHKCISVILQMLYSVIFLLEILSTYMTMILILCDYSCGKEVSESVHSGKVLDSTIVRIQTMQALLSFVVWL